MALLQLVEPGEQQPASSGKAVVGIDLGTTNTLVAAVRDGTPCALPDEQGRAAIPSVVHYRSNQAPLVGHAVTDAAADEGFGSIVSVKRLMGRGAEDVGPLAELFGYRLTGDEARVPKIQTAAGAKTAIEVSADILRVCKRRAERVLAVEAIDGAVITVPAYFDDAQRQATRDAGRLAGLDVYRLINEPTAAAVTYGLDHGVDGETVAVFDLGGGTFDVSVLRLEKGVLQVIATGGDTMLGGDDFDRVIADYLAKSAPAGFRSDDKGRRYLLGVARRAKEMICGGAGRFAEQLTAPCGHSWRADLSPAGLNRLIAPLVDRIAGICEDAFLQARMKPADVDAVVLVGGSTRVPLVRERVAAIFKREPLDVVDPDQVVAIGAAIQADTLSGNRNVCDDLLLLDVVPLSLGVETMGGLVERIIPRNSVIPVMKAQEFTTAKDGQTAISFHVVQGERDLVSDCRSLARFELKNVPPRVAGAVRVRVTFRVDADGLLTVEAEETGTGVATSVEVKPTYGLSDDEIAVMIRDSVEHAADDMQTRRDTEKRVEAGRLIESLEAALAADGAELLDEAEYKTITAAKDVLRERVDGGDYDAVERAIKELESCSEFYVERRMNNSIRRALRGHRADELK